MRAWYRGIIGEKFPGMDMVSLGPTLEGVHSQMKRSISTRWRGSGTTCWCTERPVIGLVGR